MRAPVRLCVLMRRLTLVGCSAEKPAPTAKAAGSQMAVDAAPNDVAAPAIELSVVDKAGFQKAIDAHRGKVVLVDYWATWCGPCVKQFPHTVELWHKYRDRGLDVIGAKL